MFPRAANATESSVYAGVSAPRSGVGLGRNRIRDDPLHSVSFDHAGTVSPRKCRTGASASGTTPTRGPIRSTA